MHVEGRSASHLFAMANLTPETVTATNHYLRLRNQFRRIFQATAHPKRTLRTRPIFGSALLTSISVPARTNSLVSSKKYMPTVAFPLGKHSAILGNFSDKLYFLLGAQKKIVFGGYSVFPWADRTIGPRLDVLIGIGEYVSYRTSPECAMIGSFWVWTNPPQSNTGSHAEIFCGLNTNALRTASYGVKARHPNVSLRTFPIGFIRRVFWNWANKNKSQLSPALNIVCLSESIRRVGARHAFTAGCACPSGNITVCSTPLVSRRAFPNRLGASVLGNRSDKFYAKFFGNCSVFGFKNNLRSRHDIKQAPARNNVVWTRFREALASIVYQFIVASRQMNYNRTNVLLSIHQ